MQSQKRSKQATHTKIERKTKVEEGSDKDWLDHMESKLSLEWLWTAKKQVGLEHYVRSSQVREATRTEYRMKTGMTGLLADKRM